MTADSAAAAQALAGGRGELHQSLSSLGVSLLRLDIGSFGQADAGDREGRFAQAGNPSSAPSDPSAPEEGETADAIGALDGAGAPAELQSGGLVDVLA